MTDTLKIKRRSPKSVIYYFNELFCGNPCYEHFEPDMLDTWVSHQENIEQKLLKISALTEEIGELIENDAESEDNFKQFMNTDS